MSKILITMLGTGIKKDGGYRPANYQIDGKDYPNETSIAKVLTSHCGIEKVFILGTSGSIWDNIYRVFGGKDDDIELSLYEKKEEKNISEQDLVKVSDAIDEYTGKKGSACFLVSYGLNNNELWDNFQQYLKVSGYINDKDELFLDVTHAFRSLAMMSFQMVQFIEQVRCTNITVKGIFYGMFEYSVENNGITPIVDIGILADIQEWTKAVGYFKYSGNASMLSELINSGKILTDKETKKVFKHLANSISMGNINGIKNAVGIIKRKLNSLENSVNPIARYISENIKDFVDNVYHEDEVDFSLALAEWFAACRNYSMSYMVLVDAVKLKFAKVIGIDLFSKNQSKKEAKENQKKVDSVIEAIVKFNRIDDVKLCAHIEENIGEIKEVIKNYKSDDNNKIKMFAKAYDTIRKYRNGIAHSTEKIFELGIAINHLKTYIDTVKQFFKLLDK